MMTPSNKQITPGKNDIYTYLDCPDRTGLICVDIDDRLCENEEWDGFPCAVSCRGLFCPRGFR